MSSLRFSPLAASPASCVRFWERNFPFSPQQLSATVPPDVAASAIPFAKHLAPYSNAPAEASPHRWHSWHVPVTHLEPTWPVSVCSALLRSALPQQAPSLAASPEHYRRSTSRLAQAEAVTESNRTHRTHPSDYRAATHSVVMQALVVGLQLADSSVATRALWQPEEDFPRSEQPAQVAKAIHSAKRESRAVSPLAASQRPALKG